MCPFHYQPVAVSVHDYQIIVSSVIGKISADTLEWVLGLYRREGGGAFGCDVAFRLQAAQCMRISLIAEVIPGQKNAHLLGSTSERCLDEQNEVL